MISRPVNYGLQESVVLGIPITAKMVKTSRALLGSLPQIQTLNLLSRRVNLVEKGYLADHQTEVQPARWGTSALTLQKTLRPSPHNQDDINHPPMLTSQLHSQPAPAATVLLPRLLPLDAQTNILLQSMALLTRVGACLTMRVPLTEQTALQVTTVKRPQPTNYLVHQAHN